jgi:ribosome biogenesis GTPase / thiamine phosphate phosphatase
MDVLGALGWTPSWAEAFAALGDGELRPGRVVLEHGRFYRIATAGGEVRAVATGRLQHRAETAAELPTVGDWVALHKDGELASIRHVLPRRSKFSRRSAGVRPVEQVVAANIDTVFLMMGLELDFNLRRLERYLAVAAASGARSVVVLNKADLCADLPACLAEVAGIAAGVPVLSPNLRDEEGHRPVESFLAPAETVALLGSSGVGKSTLLNRLAGGALQRTAALRERDGKGKHTTTSSQLFSLPGGALAIDTPGLRELQLWEPESSLAGAFADLEALASSCKYSDCTHTTEPACAVRAALEEGRLAPDRYASFTKLRGELEAGRVPPWEARRLGRMGARALRKRLKEKKD